MLTESQMFADWILQLLVLTKFHSFFLDFRNDGSLLELEV